MRAINTAGLAHLMVWEGFRDTAYQDTGGVWTIGFGTTRWPDGRPVRPGEQVTRDQARALIFDSAGGLRDVAEALTRMVDPAVLAELSDNQYAALCSWTYNVGIGALRRSTLLRRLNAGRLDDVPAQMKRWRYDNGRVVPGLVNRRAAEAALWRTPDAAGPQADPPSSREET